MELTGTCTPTRADYAHAVQQATRPVQLRIYVISALVVTVAVVGFIVDETGDLGWLGFGALGCAFAINAGRIGSANAKRLTGAALGPHTYSIGVHGVRVRNDVAVTEIAWHGVETIERLPDAWVLRPASKQAPLLLFRKAFDGTQDEQLTHLLRERGLLKS
jgi:hypothetical protein